jgi:hypothetical protein
MEMRGIFPFCDDWAEVSLFVQIWVSAERNILARKGIKEVWNGARYPIELVLSDTKNRIEVVLHWNLRGEG